MLDHLIKVVIYEPKEELSLAYTNDSSDHRTHKKLLAGKSIRVRSIHGGGELVSRDLSIIDLESLWVINLFRLAC
jgi:hypothetical protein